MKTTYMMKAGYLTLKVQVDWSYNHWNYKNKDFIKISSQIYQTTKYIDRKSGLIFGCHSIEIDKIEMQ